jgi:hypothetical protein
LRQWLEPAVTDPERRNDIVLAASELGAVALRTAQDSGRPVDVHAWVDNGDVVLECRAEQRAGSDGNAALELERTETERGFSIVASIADVLAVRKAPLNVVLRARLRRRAP